jgi:ectoine hydroxylase-related dioxygenase (phytanoyl-CoA dioxygenase family)
MGEEGFAGCVEDMRRDGYAILPNILTPGECDKARDELDRLADERDRGGFECLFNKARIFERIYQVPALLKFIRYFLGADALLSSMHGSILAPGNGGDALHADGAITGHNRDASLAPADAGSRITSHVVALNVIVCVSEFTAENGATELVPGSHLHPTLDRPPDVEARAMPAVADRGSAVVFNANTWHGPSKNRSVEPRYAVLNPWRRYWTRCEYELVRVVDPDVLARAGEEGRVIFGLGALPPYLELWQWDRDTGTPTEQAAELRRN